MRRLTLSKVFFRQHSVLMGSFIDTWGEDDVVLASIARGDYKEADPMSWWLAMCRSGGTGSTVMDIGSYSGLYSLLAAAFQSAAGIVAIEASSMTHGRLCHNILLNQAEMRVTPAHYAMSDVNGVLSLGHAYGIFTMASGESVAAQYPTDHEETVPAATLDRLLCLNGERPTGTLGSSAGGPIRDRAIHAIKLDTEGAEENVLRGAQGTLARWQPHLIVEILEDDGLARVSESLRAAGYRRLAECDGCNYIFSHADKAGALEAEYRAIAAQGAAEFRLERLSELNVGLLQGNASLS